MQDISDRKQAEKKLVHDAFHDALTGLPNQNVFHGPAQAIGRSGPSAQGTFHLRSLFLDFDRFKIINDSLGHMVGDQLLIAIAKRLRSSVRPGDTVARLGGDEFTILLDSSENPDDAIDMARRLLSSLSEQFQASGPRSIYHGQHRCLRSAQLATNTPKKFCEMRTPQCTGPRVWAGPVTRSLIRE